MLVDNLTRSVINSGFFIAGIFPENLQELPEIVSFIRSW